MIIAVTVTFNPDDGFKTRLESYAGQVEHVFIIDNSIDEARAAFVQSLAGGNVEVFANANVNGLAGAQNTGIAKALARGAEWIALFDDDSAASEGMFAHMLKVWQQHPKKDRTGIVVPVVFDGRTGHEHRFITWVGPLVWRRRMDDRNFMENIVTANASGMLIHTDLVRDCGMMREDYFIDWVDVEYCLRARARGWRILAVGNTCLDHTLGDKMKHALFGATFIASHHAAWRRYTMSRNRVDVWKHYWLRFPAYVIYDKLVTLYETFKIICFEREKRTKLRNMLRGFKDGLLGRFPLP